IYGLADAGAAEKSDLAAFQEWLDQVDDLDAGLEHFFSRRLLFECRSRTMNGPGLGRIQRTEFVHRLADDIDHPSQSGFPNRYRNGTTEIDGLHAADHAFGCFHGATAHTAFTEVLLNFDDHAYGFRNVEAFAGNARRLIDGRHGGFFKLDVHSRAGNLNYFADILCHKNLYRAAAPLTISIISLVIDACRTRFIVSVSESIMSEALLVAESIAVMRAACSAATDSSSAR